MTSHITPVHLAINFGKAECQAPVTHVKGYSPESQVLVPQLIARFFFFFCCYLFVCFFFLFFFQVLLSFLFVFWSFICLLIFDLLIPWFANVSVVCLLVSLVIHLFLQLLLVEGRVCTQFLSCFFFLLFFLRGKGYFILHVGGVVNSSSADQSLKYVSILEAYISFEGRVQGSGCK